MRGIVLAAVLCLQAIAASAAGFTVSTPDFGNGSTIPMAYLFNQEGCSGGNQSPALSWSGEPASTRSFAVTMYDRDAPSPSGWWHWTMFNIPPTVHALPENAAATELPPGAGQGRTDFGTVGYAGPCPPVGDRPHRYVVTVYAVKVPHLSLGSQSSGATVGSVLNTNTLAFAQTMGRYGRTR